MVRDQELMNKIAEFINMAEIDHDREIWYRPSWKKLKLFITDHQMQRASDEVLYNVIELFDKKCSE
jgi:hypothetical protein